MLPFCCYILVSADGGASYCGSTTCFPRRLRQHNGGRRAGGARYTHRRRCGGDWRPLWVVHGFANRSQALSFEWRVKHLRRGRRGGGGLQARRAAQLRAALRDPGWWEKYPPCPAEMTMTIHAAAAVVAWPADDGGSLLPFTLTVVRDDESPPAAAEERT